jgi:hypothetical protein
MLQLLLGPCKAHLKGFVVLFAPRDCNTTSHSFHLLLLLLHHAGKEALLKAFGFLCAAPTLPSWSIPFSLAVATATAIAVASCRQGGAAEGL